MDEDSEMMPMEGSPGMDEMHMEMDDMDGMHQMDEYMDDMEGMQYGEEDSQGLSQEQDEESLNFDQDP